MLDKNTIRKTFTFPLYDSLGEMITGASPMSECNKDGGAFIDCVFEAKEHISVFGKPSGIYSIGLTWEEMDGDEVVVVTTVRDSDARPSIVTYYGPPPMGMSDQSHWEREVIAMGGN